VIGAGSRGRTYSAYALDFPDRLKIVAVAEPVAYRRHELSSSLSIPPEAQFTDWRELAQKERMADFAMVTTQDQMHAEPAVAMARRGYHILLEKPMAVSEEDCERIAAACEENKVMLCVCHVLRYSPVNRKLKELVDSGVIGRLVNLTHTEPVGFFHFAHSFVRGNWCREDKSTFALMAKSCHDVDLIRWWMGGKCQSVSSFGSLSEFHPGRKPAGATDRCLDCSVEASCTYSAKRIYLEKGYFKKHVADDPSIENLTEALQTGPYGRCVWQSDNDVVDNQVVSFAFDEGRTATFSMVAFTEKLCQRETTFYGTKGQLRCFDDRHIEHADFLTETKQTYTCETPPQGTRLSNHGGSDFFLMDTFVKAIQTNDPSLISTSAADALASHRLVFCAEKARREHRVVDVAAP